MFRTDSMRRVTKASAVALMALGLAFGADLIAHGEVQSAHAQKKGSASDSSIVPVGDSPIKGKKDALVTIVEFADYQCPFCDRANNTIGDVEAKYGKDVRVVFKHFPLPFHQQADDASRAALAAGEQGKYWEMHDLLFMNFKEFKNHSGDFDAYAAELAKEAGVKSVKKFSSDLSKNAQKYDAIIARDKKLGGDLGVRGTPHFFINGVRLSGAQPLQKFESVIDAELEASRAELKKLGKKKLVYAARVKANYAKPEEIKRAPPKAEVKPVTFIPVSKKDATLGKASKALVTIVEFSDFQCPYCSRGANTMTAIKAKYGDDVRIVFKHLPLPFHKQAEGAAVAALAAGRQGKFWEMHDKLFENQSKMSTDSELFIRLADEIGLKLTRFEKDLRDPKLLAQVKADAALAGEVGARGTPNFFVNGIQITGARPEAAFVEVIDAQIKLAKKLKKKNKKLKGEKLYAALVKENEKSVPEEERVDAKKVLEDEKAAAANARKVLAVAGSPVWGDAKKAKVVIYEFTDLQCPFCSRAKDTIDEVKKTYGADVAIVSKSFPLAFHAQAEGAAIAALAAGRQGKFWEMRAAIFERQRDMKNNSELFIELADGLGLDLDRFEKDLKDPTLLAQVKAEMAMGSEVGVRGTPNFFINGVKVIGAQPFDAFKVIIDGALEAPKK